MGFGESDVSTEAHGDGEGVAVEVSFEVSDVSTCRPPSPLLTSKSLFS